MAQIIKHRRGSIGALKDVTANVGELVMATGSIGDLNAPILFIGESAIAGGYKPVSKIYQGATAPTLGASYGSTIDGTPFYSNNTKTLYILDRTGNIGMDLTGNIEGNIVSGLTINNLTGSTAYIANISGSFTGSGVGLYNIPASGITGLELNRIASGSATASISPDNGLRINTNTEVTGTLLVSSDTHIGGNVYVTGSEYVDNVISRTGNGFNALHLNGGTFGAPDVELTSANNISLFAEGGTVNVTGSMKVNGDVTVEENLYVSGNIYQTGSFYTQGDIVLSGSINIGDNISTDVINFNGEVSSSIIPKVHNAFDLGSPTNNWRNIHVSGTAYIDILEAQQVNFNDLGILTDLTVSGSTYLGNGGDITVVSGSLYNDQLTEKRMVVVGAEGLLTDYSGLTFDNGNLNLSGALEVTNIQGTGSLYLKPDLNDGRDFRIYNTAPSDIHIKGNAAYSFFGDDTNYLKIDDNSSLVTINSVSGVSINTIKTMVTGSIYNDQLTNNRIVVVGADGLLEDDSNFTFDGTTLQVGAGWFGVDTDGDIRTSGSLLVTSTSEFKDAVGINSTLDVTGSATLKSSLEVKGATGLNSTLDVTGSATLKSSLEVKGATGLNSTLDVTGSAQFKSTIDVDGVATVSSSVVEDLTQNRIVGVGVGGALIDYSGLTYDGTVLQIGGGQFEVDNADGDIRTSGSLTTNGLTNNGDLTVNGVLTVTGNTELQANLYVSGNLEVLGSSTNVNIQSTTVEIGDNIILVNAYSPFQRYAGITGYDSGSVGTSGSMLWDSLNNYWLLQNSDATTSKIIGTTSGSMGSEVSLTDTYFPIATGANTIADSLLRYSGTTLSFNTNKFTIESVSGNTYISGNVTIDTGGVDNGTLSSLVTFRNDDNILGFIDSTDTQDVTTQLLGYDAVDGTLKFSSLIDGGLY
jgi:cytoskeletal protein CcmA (bactofilin family)